MNSDLEAVLDRGMQAAREGRWEEARTVFLDVVSQDPSGLEAWLWLGAIAEDPKDSVAYLEKALSINPNSVRAQKGMEWARDRLAAAGAVIESAVPPAGAVEAIDGTAMAEPQTGSEAVLALDDFSQAEAVFPDADLPVAGVSETPVESEPISTMSVAPQIQLDDERAFADEGLSPLKIGDEEDIQTFALDKSPEAAEDISGPVSANLTLEALFSGMEAGVAPDDEQDETPTTLSSLGLTPISAENEPASTPVDQPPSDVLDTSDRGLGDLQDSPAGAENWDAIIARLRALDDEMSQEAAAPPRDDVGPDAADGMAYDATPSFAPAPLVESPSVPESWAAVPADLSADTVSGPITDQPPAGQTTGKADDLVEVGKQYFDAGQIAEAIQSFRGALAIDPANVDANEQLGVAQYQSGNLAEAIKSFEAVVRLKPDQAEAHANLGFLYAEQGNADRAIAAFHDALQHNSGLVEAYLSIADLYKAQGKIDEAVEAWSAAAQLRPDLPDVHINLGEVYAEREQPNEAIWEFRLVVDRKPDDPKAHFRLAQLLLQVGRAIDASREFKEALRLAPDMAEAHYGLATCLEEQEIWDEAIAELEKALVVRPGYLEADERLVRLRAAIASPQEPPGEEVKEDQKKKSGWFIFKRDKK